MRKIGAAGQRRRRVDPGRAIAALSLGITLGITLAGCLADRDASIADQPVDFRQRHPIAIREGERTVDLLIGVDRGGLLPAQQAEVLGFAASWRQEATGGVVIDLPIGTPNERAAADALREVRAILTAASVPARAIAVRRYRPPNPHKLATLKLSYPKMLAEAGPCGQWPRDIGTSYQSGDTQNRDYWNLGCSQQQNLAAMVEDPSDLLQPRSETPASSARRTTVFDKYRKGESTATTYTNTNQGKISDVGQ
jgi:pilus assembly protein CpaD